KRRQRDRIGSLFSVAGHIERHLAAGYATRDRTGLLILVEDALGRVTGQCSRECDFVDLFIKHTHRVAEEVRSRSKPHDILRGLNEDGRGDLRREVTTRLEVA